MFRSLDRSIREYKISAVWKARAPSQVAFYDIPQGNSQEALQLSTPPSLDFQNCEPNKTCFFINEPDAGFILWQKEREGDTEKGRAPISSLEVGDHNRLETQWRGNPTDDQLASLVVAPPVSMLFSTPSKPHLRNSYFWF